MKPSTLIKKLLIGSGHVTKYSRYLSLDRSINLVTDFERLRYYSLSRCASTQAALHSYHQLLSPHQGAQSHCSLKLWNPLSASLSKADEIEETMMKHSSLGFDQKTPSRRLRKENPPNPNQSYQTSYSPIPTSPILPKAAQPFKPLPQSHPQHKSTKSPLQFPNNPSHKPYLQPLSHRAHIFRYVSSSSASIPMIPII